MTRLSRKVLLGLGTAAADRDRRRAVPRLAAAAADHRLRTLQHRQSLHTGRPRQLPRDYTGLAAQRAATRTAAAWRSWSADRQRPARQRPECRHPAAGPDPEQQRIAQEQEAARTSHLFATTNAGQNAAPSVARRRAAAQAVAAALRRRRRSRPRQDHKLAFLNGNIDRRTVSPDRIERARQPVSRSRPAR